MKFFTLDLYHRFNSPDVDEAVRADADWEDAIVRYKNYLQTYRDELPPGAKKLAEEVNLHDAEVLGRDFEYLATGFLSSWVNILPQPPVQIPYTIVSQMAAQLAIMLRVGDEINVILYSLWNGTEPKNRTWCETNVVRKAKTSLLSRKGNLMLTEMFPVRFWITLTVAALSLSSGALSADDQESQKAGKAVRLVWFPRFSPDGKRLITAHGSWDANEGGEVRVWEAETGKPRFVIPTERGVRTVAWATNGKSFVSGDYGGSIFFYDAETGNQTDQIKLPGNVEVLQSSADGKRLYAAAGDGSVRVWEVPSKNQVHTWKMLHRGGIWGMALSPDGKMLATAGQDHFARLLDTENFKVLHQFQHPADVNGVVFSKNNKTLLTGCGDAAIRVFDVASSNEIRKLRGHTSGSVTDLDFSPDGKFLASGGMDRTVRIWDLVDFEKPKLKSTFGGFNDFVFGVAISPNRKWLAAVGWDDQIKLLDLSTMEEKWSWRR